ncbi:unnamed protein product [Dicrocoelium dendriticum]|nr:unnamed protein product [Dicrocoelium dendriticum]
MRFAFKIKGSNVSVQPDLPLADRLKLTEAIKSLKSRRAAGDQGLRLVDFQMASNRATGLSNYNIAKPTSGALTCAKIDNVLPSQLSALSIDTNCCVDSVSSSNSNTSTYSASGSRPSGNYLPSVFNDPLIHSSSFRRQSLSDQSSPELPSSVCTSNSSNNSSSPKWSIATSGTPSTLGASKGTLLTDKQNGGLVGLNNLGNTCFMNSIIQCLSNTQPLLDYCLSNRYNMDLNKASTMHGTLFASYVSLMKELWNPDMFESSTNPSHFKSQIQRFAPRFVGYSQQDSQEFLRYLLEGLHMEVNRVTKRPHLVVPDYEAEDRLPDLEKAELYWNRYLSVDNSEIVDLFVGQLMSTLECAECGFKSTTFDPFWDLSLPIPKKSNVTIMDCLRLFTSKDDLDGNERPVCGRCKLRRRCTKSFSIQKFPHILVLHLKRFSGERFRSKMSMLVDYPINNLDLLEFSSPSCQQRYALYNLYAVSNHSGSVYAGHYTAICKHRGHGSWFEYNDSRVRPVSRQSVVSAEGYVLFYELAN